MIGREKPYFIPVKGFFYTSKVSSCGKYQTDSVLKCCMLRGQSLSGNVRGLGVRSPPRSPETYYCWDIASNWGINNINNRHNLYSISILCLRVFLTFYLQLQPAATRLHLRYSVSYTKTRSRNRNNVVQL